MKVFVDNWGWLVLGDRKEQRHEQVENFYLSIRKQGAVAYTTDYVLDETITLLFRRIGFRRALDALDEIQASIEKGYVVVEWVGPRRFNDAKALRRKFSDKPDISFTDLTTMAVMSELKISDVLTEDDHFVQVGLGFRKVP